MRSLFSSSSLKYLRRRQAWIGLALVAAGMLVLDLVALRGMQLAADRQLAITYWPVSPAGLAAGALLAGLGWLLKRTAPAPLAGRWQPWGRTCLTLGVFTTIFLVCWLGHSLVQNIDRERDFPDTALYAQVAGYALTDWHFWSGPRPFTLPLAYHWLDIHSENIWLRSEMKRIAGLQANLALLGWTCLGLALAANLRRPAWQALAFATILGFSLNQEISQWDHLLLSESLSMSFFAMLLTLLLVGTRLIERPLPLPARVTCLLKSFYLLGLGLVATLYAFTRDTNAYFLWFTAALILFSLLVPSFHKRLPFRTMLLAAALLSGIAGMQNASAEVGRRWQGPFSNVLVQRLLPDRQARVFFVRAGLPIDAAVLALPTLEPRQLGPALANSPELRPLVSWIDQSGKSTYLRYLLSRPWQSLTQPLADLDLLISPGSNEYRFALQSTPRWMSILSTLTYPRAAGFVLSSTLGVLLTLGWCARRGAFSPGMALPCGLILLIYPLMFLVWHADVLEIERHAAQIGVQLRLAIWMGIFLILDALASCPRPNPGYNLPA